MKSIACLFVLSIVFACKAPQTKPFNQGIKGRVLWMEGNFMPGPDKKKNGEPVGREIMVYELTTTDEAKKEGNFYVEITTELVKTVRSDENGNYKAALPVGHYSVFVKEEKGLYANLQDSQGNIQPVEVTANEYTTFDLNVDYKAVY